MRKILFVVVSCILLVLSLSGCTDEYVPPNGNGETPVADAGGPYSGEVNTAIQFYGSVTGGLGPFTYNWDYGDGSQDTGQNPTHTYTSLGDYDVSLTVIDLNSQTDIDVTSANVYQAPEEYWTWTLPADEWTEVTFTYEMIICVGSDETEELFASIINVAGGLWVFQQGSDGEWRSWYSEREINELEHIEPNIPCNVHPECSCTLAIVKC